MNHPSRLSSSGPLRTALALAVAVAGIALLPTTALAQVASPNPPARMTYQGFLVGSDGVSLGNVAPKNYDVIFTVYNNETASASANVLWGEQQTVTVDKGYFSILLGEGATVSGLPHTDLSGLFKGADASDRFVGITVKGIGTGGANVDITPRLRLLSSPYAFLAKGALKLVGDTGVELISGSGNEVTVTGKLKVDTLTVTNATVVGTLTATSLSGSGSVPLGGIIMWSGAINAVPVGWALCNGQTVNGQKTPDLRDRMVLGAGNTYAVGASGGGSSVTLATANLPNHTHGYKDAYLARLNPTGNSFVNLQGQVYNNNNGNQSYDDNFLDLIYRPNLPRGFQNSALTSTDLQTDPVGSGTSFSILNPYYSLGYIMRVQ